MKDNNICPICSFPRELCICEKLEAEEQKVKIYNERRRWGKIVTIAKFNGDFSFDLDNLSTKAKIMCASGGTYGDDYIEVQGDHRFKLKKLLMDVGFPKTNIIVE